MRPRVFVFIVFAVASGIAAGGFADIQPIGEILQIATQVTGQNTPRGAVSPITGEFFVIWRHQICHEETCSYTNEDIRGRFIDTSGNMKPIRPLSFPITQGQAADGRAQIQYNSQENNYLLAWYDSVSPNFGTYTRVISPDGKPLTRHFIGQDGEVNSLAYNPITNLFLLASRDGFRSIRADGTSNGPTNRIESDAFSPRVFTNSGDVGYKGFFLRPNASRGYDLYFQSLNSDGTRQGTARKIATSKTGFDTTIPAAYNPLRKEFLIIIGGDSTQAGHQLKAVRVDLNGRVLSPPVIVAVEGSSRVFSSPTISYVPNKGYLLCYERGQIFAKQLGALGRPASSEVQLTNSPGTRVEFQSLYSAKSSRVLVFWFKIVYGFDQELYGRLVQIQ